MKTDEERKIAFNIIAIACIVTIPLIFLIKGLKKVEEQNNYLRYFSTKLIIPFLFTVFFNTFTGRENKTIA